MAFVKRDPVQTRLRTTIRDREKEQAWVTQMIRKWSAPESAQVFHTDRDQGL